MTAYNPKYPKPDESTVGYCTWTSFNFVNDDFFDVNCSIVEFPDGSYLQLKVEETTEDGNKTTQLLNFTEPFQIQVKKVDLQVIPANGNRKYGGRFFCTISLSGVEKKACVCGQRNMEKMIGGVRAAPNEFPSVAGVVFNRFTFLGGATIVANRVALTTAAAIYQIDPRRSVLSVGDESVGRVNGSSAAYEVSLFITHEKYEKSKQLYNIGMVITENEIKFGPNVGPACLTIGPRPPLSNSMVELVGWGATEVGGSFLNPMHRGYSQVTPLEACQKAYSEELSEEQHLCIYWPGTGACEKDFGGPMYYTIRQNARLYLSGIIADGSCGEGDKPDLTIRMTSFTNWVQEQYPGIQLCGDYRYGEKDNSIQ